MKKLLLLLVIAYWLIPAYSQNLPYVIGFGGASLTTASGFKTSYAGGQCVATPYVSTSDGRVMTGFKFDLKYFSNTFEKDLFVSKGYYADYVDVKWEVKRYADQITRFSIWRKKFGTPEDSVMVGSIIGSDREWKDEYAESGVIYKYTLFAEGITNNFQELYINYLEGIGFRFPSGTVSGRITFQGGTAVEGVNVYAETDDVLGGKSILLNGTDAYIAVSPPLNDPYFKFDTAFCFEGWFKPTTAVSSCLFEKGTQYKITHQPGQVTFIAGGTSLSVNFTERADTFFHVAAQFKGDSIKLFVLYNNKTFWKSSAKIASAPLSNSNEVFIGKETTGNFFNGYADELRIWHKGFTDQQIINNSGILISGADNGLTAYFRCDEGIGENAFDLSRSGFTFNEHHAYIYHGQWTSIIPLHSQLAFKGITDKNGNYIIAGIPYATDGSTYHITPAFEVHRFDPTEALLLISDGSNTHNGINFTDVSSFPVLGNVKYLHTNFPVFGTNLYVDGKIAITKNGMPVSTDANGNFTVDVPIGNHYVSVGMNGHGFQHGGRYPMPEPGNSQPYHYFQEPISGLQFMDTTLIKVVGRVVGGPLQATKPLGFGKSVNNLGYATIVFSTQSQHDLTDAQADTGSIWQHQYLEGGIPKLKGLTGWQINKLTPKLISVQPDHETGEYVAWLLPEKYTVSSITAGTYTFGDEFKSVVDLTNSYDWQQTVDSTFTGIHVTSGGVTDSIYRMDSMKYQFRKDFIYRVAPQVNVTALDGSKVFWDKEATVDTVTIALNDSNGNPLTGYPVFTQLKKYALKVSVFEKYINRDVANREDLVAVSDGNVEIQNFIASDNTKQVIDVDKNGEVVYNFIGGLPNITTDATGGYTLTMTIVANTGNNGAIKTQWPDSTFKAYLFGAVAIGNNFVTTGPTSIDMILRDPPGAGSSSSLQEQSVITNTTSYSTKDGISESASLTHKLGTTVAFITFGAPETKMKATNDVSIGLSSDQTWSYDHSLTTKITNTQKWSTGSSSGSVGAMADVFIGHASNIVYGKSINIRLISSKNCNGTCVGNNLNGYKIGKATGLWIDPEFGTTFLFTQDHILNYLIPNLTTIRNSFFTRGDGVYVSKRPASDPNYGAANTDTLNLATWLTDNKIDGNSYSITIPAHWPKDSLFVDSIYFYNQQIADWTDALRRNEKEKIEAKLKENISFSAGAKYDNTIAYDTSSTYNHKFDFTISPTAGTSFGIDVNGFGIDAKLSAKYTHSSSKCVDCGGTQNSVTFAYSLADDNGGNYLSIDVKTPPSQTGPVFSIKGGQTKCPYEGAIKTKFEQPGKVISEATMQREKCTLSAESPIISNIPEDKPANFKLLLSNISETGEDGNYNLSYDQQTNPNGAIISLDGSPLDASRSIKIPAGKTIEKILSIQKTLPAVYDYENIKLSLASSCGGGGNSIGITAHFVPACSGIAMTNPTDLWVANTITGTNMDIGIDGYNLSHSTFEKILYQYKSSSSSNWITDMTFFVNKADYDEASEPKTYINNQASMNYTWDLSGLPDRNYDIRLQTICYDNTENFTDPFSGIKDVKPPKVFGTPQPGDGIVSPNDDIMVTFDEPIQAGLLTPYNFSVRDVLNGAKIDHNACLYFEGIKSYANVLTGVPLNDKSFTIEFWAKRASLGEQVIFSQGNDIEIGFDASDRFYTKLGATSIKTTESFTDLTLWQHWAVAYDKDSKTAQIYMNDQILRDNTAIPVPILGAGRMLVGKSVNDNRFFNGSLHELRIWEKMLPFSKVYADMYTSFNGREIGLAGYWPMNEADGTKAEDFARHRHAVLYGAQWRVFPSGNGREFNGTSDYVDIYTGSTVVITKDMDYTLEFWFKAPKQFNTTLFSNGKADGTDNDPRAQNALLVGVNGNGEIFALNNNIPLIIKGEDFLDNTWHHFALVTNRIGNVTIYMDGVQKNTLRASDFGGFTGASMCIGARRYKNPAIKHDNFFKGKIDEFRIWKLARELKQIQLDKNAHLTGKEIGLCAYYPFEYYFFNMGVPEIRSTLDDMYIPQYAGYPTGGTAIASGGQFTDDVPNIKDARPLQNIAFNWTVNTDKIIITPNEPNELIENTIVELTVQNVEDLNENRLASPVTWTAFINKNQVLWDASELHLEKKIYDPFSFSVDILNVGGKQQSFSIENLPSWLTASETTGILQPDSKQTITFTVNEALSIGKYQESIFLHSDFGYSEKLLLDLNVYKPAPSWQVDKSKYQYSMNVIAQLKIDNEISADSSDLIGAFVNGECRGTAHLAYFEAYDKYIAFISIYSNSESGDSVKFKVWDASEGIIRSKVTPQYLFVENDVKGTVSNPEILTALGGYYSEIAMMAGWNWISFNLNSPDLQNLNTTFSKPNRMPGDQIKGPVDTTGMVLFDNYISGSWSSNFANAGGLKPGYMYMVKTSKADSIILVGEKINVTSSPLYMHNGWNWLGYMPLTAMTVNDAFAYFAPAEGDLLKSKYAFSMYNIATGWLGSLDYLKPGEGYMLKTSKKNLLMYPESGMYKKSASSENQASSSNVAGWNYNAGLYPSNMSLIAKVILPGNTVADNQWCLGAFAGNECRGTASAKLNSIDNRYNFFLTVAGSTEAENIQFKLVNTATGKLLDIKQTMVYSPDAISGTLKDPVILNALEVKNTGLNNEPTYAVSPNPFSTTLKIIVQSPDNATLVIQVYNNLGELMDIQQTPVNTGFNTIKWDNDYCSKFVPGVYYIKFIINEQVKVMMVVKN
jgi:hypothetical protein